MTPRQAISLICILLGVLVSLPIGFYLQYRVLQLVDATNVMWLLFWVNLPVVMVLRLISEILDKTKK